MIVNVKFSCDNENIKDELLKEISNECENVVSIDCKDCNYTVHARDFDNNILSRLDKIRKKYGNINCVKDFKITGF